MSKSAIASRTASAERASLGAVLGQRNIWLFFALGFATGLPAHSAWQNNFARIDLDIDSALLLAFTSFGISGLIAFAAAPFLDRYRAPGFARLAHRKSWVAATLCAAVVLFALFTVTKLASAGAATRFGAISGVAAVAIAALLSIAVDALRIDLYRGRAQAVAMAAQYMGALTSAMLLVQLALESATLLAVLVCAGLLIIGFGTLLLIREPAPAHADSASHATASATVSYRRPWTTFFARNGRASGFLLAAIAFYALAVSTADFLGRHGYLVDLLRSDFRGHEPATGDALSAVGTQTAALAAIGIMAGMLIAFVTAPARAFFFMMLSILALLGFFVLCKIALGFTVFTVAGLYALRTIIWAASFIIYVTIAARMTARPDTAGHVAILSLFTGLVWISDQGLTALAAPFGSYGLAAGAALAAIASLLCLRLAARAARRAGN